MRKKYKVAVAFICCIAGLTGCRSAAVRIEETGQEQPVQQEMELQEAVEFGETLSESGAEEEEAHLFVKLESETVNVSIEKNTRILASVYPEEEQELVFQSSNEEIATVDDKGIVTAKRPGTVTITVAVEENPEVKSQETLTVVQYDGWVLLEGETYYYLEGERQKNTEVEGKWLAEDGHYTTGDEELDAMLKEVILEVASEDIEGSVIFERAYKWVMEHYTYAARRNFVRVGADNWENEYAREALSSRKGNCYSYAATVALLARKCGLTARGVSGNYQIKGWGSDTWYRHGWVEVEADGETRICDAEMEGSYAVRNGYDWDLFMVTEDEAPLNWRE